MSNPLNIMNNTDFIDVEEEDYLSVDSDTSNTFLEDGVITSDLEYIAKYAVDHTKDIHLHISPDNANLLLNEIDLSKNDSDLFDNVIDEELSSHREYPSVILKAPPNRSHNVGNDDTSSDTSQSEESDIAIDLVPFAMVDDEDEEPVISGPIRTKHELEEKIIDNDDIEILPNDELYPVGKIVSNLIEDSQCTIVIQSNYGFENLLEEGSVVCLSDRIYIGKVNELFGPITCPYYILRCNVNSLESKLQNEQRKKLAAMLSTYSDSEDENDNDLGDSATAQTNNHRSKIKGNIQELINDRLTKGLIVYSIRRLSQRISTDILMNMKAQSKGSDASNAYDEEIPEDEQEFSDDEKEMMKKNGVIKPKTNDSNRMRQERPHAQRQGIDRSHQHSMRSLEMSSFPQSAPYVVQVPSVSQLSMNPYSFPLSSINSASPTFPSHASNQLQGYLWSSAAINQYPNWSQSASMFVVPPEYAPPQADSSMGSLPVYTYKPLPKKQ